MDNLTPKEELQILKAANLAGAEAPEKLDAKRARSFVREHLASEKKSRGGVRFSPATYATFALAACVAAALIVLQPGQETKLQLMQQDSVHAAADSVSVASDSLKTAAPENFELVKIDE